MLKKAYDTEGLANKTQRNLNFGAQNIVIETRGVGYDNLIEPTPTITRRKSGKIIEGANNASITVDRDRPGAVGSGYGDQTGAGAIDIVVGHVSSNIQSAILNNQTFSKETLSVDPNLALDASRIYLSQKTDIDHNFNLADGRVGSSTARSGIALKSDSLRLIAREGVKIVTKVDTRNSQGAGIISIPRIDLIAGNDDSNQQFIVTDKNIKVILKDVMSRLDELNSTLDSFMTAQMELNSCAGKHDHFSPTQVFMGTMAAGDPLLINKGKVPVSIPLQAATIKCLAMQEVAKQDGVMNKLKIALTEMNTTEVCGDRIPNSINTTVS